MLIASRAPEGYALDAARLAFASRATLVVLCSHDAIPELVLDEIDRAVPCVRHVVVPIPDGYALPGLTLETDAFEELAHYRTNDGHVKRNVALALAQRLGWRRILFMNDDLVAPGVDALRRTVGSLGGRIRAAGWAFEDFPDNSVVGHAKRLAGFHQAVAVSDAFLAVELAPHGSVPFFPALYGEDWLFLHEFIRASGVALVGDDLRQRRYDPFCDPGRAAREEFSDTLAEAVFAALHRHRPRRLTRAEFAVIIRGRAAAIEEISDRLRTQLATALDPEQGRRAIAALARAHESHRDDWPALMEDWMGRWGRDRLAWSGWLAAGDPAVTVRGALNGLGLRGRALGLGAPEHVHAGAWQR